MHALRLADKKKLPLAFDRCMASQFLKQRNASIILHLLYVCNMFLQVASALLVSFAEGSLDGVSVTSNCVTEFRFLWLAGRYLRTLHRLDCLALLPSHRLGCRWLALLAKLLLGGPRLRQSLMGPFEKWRAQLHTRAANTRGCLCVVALFDCSPSQ